MKIGMIGVGKLGLPLCLAMEQKGHDVLGYDVDPRVAGYIEHRYVPYEEEGAQQALETTKLRIAPMADVLSHGEIIFVAVQTPHDRAYEGATPIPDTRADFDYSTLRSVIAEIGATLDILGIERPIVVISTVLPGTMRRYILPGVSAAAQICYSPSFIAMGTAMRDFLFPELVLFGVDNKHAAAKAREFFQTITDAPFHETTIENAELIKVSYNTMIGMKIAFANTIMEICHKTPGTDVDDVIDALSLAKRRLISAAYLRGGMGDGGGCHPRDNIALSWLARELDLSHDFFFDIMKAREDQSMWLADLAIEQHRKVGLPIVLLGESFKGGTNILTGSPALLLKHQLAARGYHVESIDPIANPSRWEELFKDRMRPSVFVISTNHEWNGYLDFLPTGSVVIDPHRRFGQLARFGTYIPVGRGNRDFR